MYDYFYVITDVLTVDNTQLKFNVVGWIDVKL